MSTRFVNCEACQTEGRILTNDGGPDDVDHGVCPECKGERVVEVETQPMTEAEFYDNIFATGHKADCGYMWDHYWWECDCGLIPVTELEKERATRDPADRGERFPLARKATSPPPADTDIHPNFRDRTFPESQNRSNRIRKKLVKRHGGEFAPLPRCP
jgi:hypothetical protein